MITFCYTNAVNQKYADENADEKSSTDALVNFIVKMLLTFILFVLFD